MKYIDWLKQRINIIGNKHVIEFPVTVESIERLRKNKNIKRKRNENKN